MTITKISDERAFELVKTALESGTLKLVGGNGVTATSKRNAEADAAYILTLIKSLTDPTAEHSDG